MTYKEALLLTGDNWASLSDEKKIEVLQTIENHMAFESKRLPSPVIGKFLYTGNDGIVLGTYSPKNQVIYINTSQFDPDSKYGKDSEALITACLHEGRHAYQNQVVNGVVECDDKYIVDEWKNNLSGDNYISFKENPRAYYNQPVEVDARRFAEIRYQELIEERKNCYENGVTEDEAKVIFEAQIDESTSVSTEIAASFLNENIVNSASVENNISF